MTVTGDEASDIQPLASVKVNLALPGPTAVTTPEELTVATKGFKAVHVPALTGETASVVVAKTHIWVAPVILTTGLLVIVTAAVGNETQPETDEVKVNVAEPTATPVTSPPLLTVAIEKLLVAHDPACEGLTVTVVVNPGQMVVGLFKVAVGRASTVMVNVLVHPVPLSVKVIIEVPADTPVTVLPLTVATPRVPLDHVPPEDGVRVVVAPTHIVEAFAKTVGRGLTFIFPVVLLQPVDESVKVKLVVPWATPVTTPLLATVATAGLLLTHVPPVIGDRVVVPATQIVAGLAVTIGLGNTTTGPTEPDVHPVLVSVQTNVALPAVRPVTRPELLMAATVPLLDAHVPPVLGLN